MVDLRLKRDSEVLFNHADHSYCLNGKDLISCTTLLKKHNLSPSYSGVNGEKLEASANYGRLVHGEIEKWIKFDEEGFTEEFEAFKKWAISSEFDIVDNEYIVNNEIVAGTVDLLLKNKKTNEYVIADIKTTSTIHTESVSWQLSVYAKLDNAEIKKRFMRPLKRRRD